MTPGHSAARTEREKKLSALLSFVSNLAKRFDSSRDLTLVEDLQTHIRRLPLNSSSAVTAKQDELDRTGTELWNLATRLWRNEQPPNGHSKEDSKRRDHTLCLLRVFAFLLIDSGTRGRDQRSSARLMTVALKAARVCITTNELSSATKVLERAADYQEALTKETDGERVEEAQRRDRLRIEYFAVRMTLAWRQDRMDTAEHMFSKSKQLNCPIAPSTAETLADLLFEIGKDLLKKRNYELAVRWLERSYDAIGEQELEMLGPEAGELRLSIMQSIVQAYMKLNSPQTHKKAWDMVNLLDIDYGEKLAVSLLKLELLSADSTTINSSQFYSVLLQMIRSVVMNETNFRTIMHYIHKLKDHSAATSCKILDDLIDIRLFSDENKSWIERAVITRIWISTTSPHFENCLDSLKDLFDVVKQNTKYPLAAPATHAAQTLLWKRVEAAYLQEQYAVAESWCRVCLHPLFDKAGELNKSKIGRKIILCASARQDYAAAREIFNKMSDTGREEPITRYLMYKTMLNSGESDFIAECLDIVCRQSSKDATLLYACVLEAQNVGDKQQAILALQKVLKKYDFSAPVGVHLPALLRCTARLLMVELSKDGKLRHEILDQLCDLFEGACVQAKRSQRKPSTSTQQLFNSSEFEWFYKNAYNLSLKHCAEIHPSLLVRLLETCIEFVKILQCEHRPEDDNDLPLRLLFCDFLAACAFATLARAEDNIQVCLQHYVQVRKHGQGFRHVAAEQLEAERLRGPAKSDIISKHFQIVKLELEAVLKLEQWDALNGLFEECWKYQTPDFYETLADLVLVAHSCAVKANLDGNYQSKILSVLQKIINLSWRVTGNDIVKLSRWIRCLFQLALTFDESISMKCLDQAAHIASCRHSVRHPITPPKSSPLKVVGVASIMADEENQSMDHYPRVELEWLATTSFNLAVDYYLQQDDVKAKTWAEKALKLTDWIDDDGEMKGILVEKHTKLQWKDE
ncbi:SPO22-domain-containing protein [Pleomassaria siparia CBS 279.74]|uniref:Protein ZIP4 homolog n=1 Tax=Pleomassaria siparia CBS 279.74 TaxID=1314801 RepID=A0A6G1KH94_9PLEO|nr:SPO22-domain-containing protein [Pleomassaria siparia CBS 279.74]